MSTGGGLNRRIGMWIGASMDLSLPEPSEIADTGPTRVDGLSVLGRACIDTSSVPW